MNGKRLLFVVACNHREFIEWYRTDGRLFNRELIYIGESCESIRGRRDEEYIRVRNWRRNRHIQEIMINLNVCDFYEVTDPDQLSKNIRKMEKRLYQKQMC